MKIVVTGGTGFIGRALVPALLREGHEVVLVSRKGSERREGGALVVPWDPKRGASYAAHLEGSDAVIHLAGEGIFDKRWTQERRAELRASRVDVTAELARTLAGLQRRPQVLVSGSAVGIYGMRSDDSISTEDDRTGGDFLADLAVDWEKAAAPAQGAGIRVCFPRIGIVLGDGGALGRMLPPFRLGLGGPLGDGRQWFSWIHVEDTVRALTFALRETGFAGPFNVTAPEPVTMNELARAIGRAVHRPVLARVPGFALKMVMGDGQAEALLKGQRVLPKKLQDAGFTFLYPNVDGALRSLLEPRAA